MSPEEPQIAKNATDLLADAERLLDAKRLSEAAQLFQAVLAKQPDQVTALHRLGVIAAELEMSDRAIRLMRKALRAGGETPELLNDLGKVYVQVGDFENGQRCFRRCIDRYGESPLGYVSQAYVENQLHRFDEARALYDVALTRIADSPELIFNAATFHRERGRLDLAIGLYDQLVRSEFDGPLVREGRARALLQGRQWSTGWDEYESRFDVEEEPARINLDLPIRRWQGEPLSNKRLLVIYEQGVGDEIQFASCYRDVIERSDHCTFTCSPRLQSVLARSFPEPTFIPVEPQRRDSWSPEEPCRFDYFTPAGSLPRFCRREDAAFDRRAYVKTAGRSGKANARPRSLRRVGLSWWGGAVTDQIEKRSIPFDAFRPILEVPGISFVNLQHGSYDRQHVDPNLRGVDNLDTCHDIDPYRDLDRWFELIDSLDLVVSVDNSNVHFAGSLGIETWLILSDHPNWRWPNDLETSNWYRAVHFLRQQGRDWETVMDGVATRLKSWASSAATA